jgi:formylglycine-generating enzyme required for sulfatase activity
MGVELPTEAEWEFAARGGIDSAEYVWGNEFTPGGRHLANTWQGEFPWQNLKRDGYETTSPVAAFPPNSYGLYDMAGNVWEWTGDWFREHRRKLSCCGTVNPSGGRREESRDPQLPLGSPRKVIKGGSFLCAPNYSRRYRPAARVAQAIDDSTCDLGFRCVIRSETKPDFVRTLRLVETTCVYSVMDL